jgi:hypothetical protein
MNEDKTEEDFKIYSPSQALLLFKILRKKGYVINKGRTIGTIWNAAHTVKRAWMLRDLQGNWMVQMLPGKNDAN